LLLYYITDRRQFPGDPREQRARLLDKMAEAASAGVDYIQLREKDLSSRDLEVLAGEALARIATTRAKLLINSRSDVAAATGAHGVHLTSNDIPAGDARSLWSPRTPIVAVSCHSAREVRSAASQGADFAVLGPIFGKGAAPGIGLQVLAEACGRLPVPEHTESAPEPPRFPVLALGGVTLENAAACIAAGAAGVAGIRLFQENEVAAVIHRLKSRSLRS
jgi:thiamine-phosphate pyrophosphorylase